MICRSTSLFCFLLLWGVVLTAGLPAPVYAELYDDFESGNLAKWSQVLSSYPNNFIFDVVDSGGNLKGYVYNDAPGKIKIYTGFPFVSGISFSFTMESTVPVSAGQCRAANIIYAFADDTNTDIARVFYTHQTDACASFYVDSDTKKHFAIGSTESRNDTIDADFFSNAGITINMNEIAYVKISFQCHNTNFTGPVELWVDDVNVSGIPMVVMGDVNGDDSIDFATDVQTAVKTAAGVDTSGEIDDLFNISGKSVGGDVRVGSAEAVHDMQVLNSSRTVP